MKTVPSICTAFIAGAFVVLVCTFFLAYLNGQELYDTAFVLGIGLWMVFVTGCSLASFIAFIVFTVVALRRRAPGRAIGWHLLCIILAMLTPLCTLKTVQWTRHLSRRALFKKAGIDTLRRDASILCQNYSPDGRRGSRFSAAQQVGKADLPHSFQTLGISGVYVFPKHVFALTGGFGSVRSGYNFLPIETKTPLPVAGQIANGIYHTVTRD